MANQINLMNSLGVTVGVITIIDSGIIPNYRTPFTGINPKMHSEKLDPTEVATKTLNAVEGKYLRCGGLSVVSSGELISNQTSYLKTDRGYFIPFKFSDPNVTKIVVEFEGDTYPIDIDPSAGFTDVILIIGANGELAILDILQLSDKDLVELKTAFTVGPTKLLNQKQFLEVIVPFRYNNKIQGYRVTTLGTPVILEHESMMKSIFNYDEI